MFEKYDSMKEWMTEGKQLDVNEYEGLLHYIETEINEINEKSKGYTDELDQRFAFIQVQILEDVKELINMKLSSYRF